MPATYRIDGVDLHQPGRWRLLQGTQARLPVTARAALVQAPARHGVVVAAPTTFDEAYLSLRHETTGADLEEAEANAGALLALLGRPAGFVLDRVMDLVVRTATARLVSVSTPEPGPQPRTLRFTSTIALPGAFWRGVAATETLAVAGKSATVTVSSLAGSTAPVDDAVLRFLSGVGADAIGAAGVWVQDASNGTGFVLEGARPESHYLYVDCSTYRAWYVATAQAGAGDMWAAPGVGATEVTASATVDALPAGMLSIEARPHAGDAFDRRAQITVNGTTSVTIRAQGAYL